MKILTLKQILPTVAFAAGTAGALSTSTVERAQRVFGPVAAYERLNLNGDCKSELHVCESVNTGAICRVGYTPGGAQLWGKNVLGKCNIIVYMPLP
jgi:hypothetical protein